MPPARNNTNRTAKPVSLTGNLDINILLAFVFGVIFLGVMLVFSVYFPNPTEFQVRVWITCLGLSAAGIGALLPGFIEVKYKGFIRATGAAAFFGVVYASQPVLVQHGTTLIEPKGDAMTPALSFLVRLDEGKPKEAHAELDADAKRVIADLPTFEKLYQNYRGPMGASSERSLVATNTITNPPGYPLGIYRQLGFRSKFQSGCRAEQVILRAGQDLSWHVWSYTISPTTIPCE